MKEAARICLTCYCGVVCSSFVLVSSEGSNLASVLVGRWPRHDAGGGRSARGGVDAHRSRVAQLQDEHESQQPHYGVCAHPRTLSPAVWVPPLDGRRGRCTFLGVVAAGHLFALLPLSPPWLLKEAPLSHSARHTRRRQLNSFEGPRRSEYFLPCVIVRNPRQVRRIALQSPWHHSIHHSAQADGGR